MNEPPEVLVDTCNGVNNEHDVTDDPSEMVHQNGDDGYVNYARYCINRFARAN